MRGGLPDSLMSSTHSRVEAEYVAATPTSAAVFRRAQRVLPGGETRAVTTYSPHPVAIEQGQGARLIDADGHEYLDLVNNYTSLVHGNAFAPAHEAVAALLPRGVAFASPLTHQLALAEHLVTRIDSIDKIRFTNSGTEASLLALRIAQRSSSRRSILMFENAYHGSACALSPSHPDIVTVPWNDLERTTEALASRTIAAVIAEPFLGAGGVRPAAHGFLQAVQTAAKEAGSLFVLDEVQALRTAAGGAQSQQDLRPDLTVLGKIIGGGFPIGAVGGRADLLDLTAAALTADHVPHAGTFNGHLAATVAGLVTLQHLDQDTIDRLNSFAAALEAAASAALRTAGLVGEVTRSGSILNIHLAEPGHDATLHLALLLEGVYTAPRGMMNLSTALTEDDMHTVSTAIARATSRIAA